jgi:hypothetical protein
LEKYKNSTDEKDDHGAQKIWENKKIISYRILTILAVICSYLFRTVVVRKPEANNRRRQQPTTYTPTRIAITLITRRKSKSWEYINGEKIQEAKRNDCTKRVRKRERDDEDGTTGSRAYGTDATYYGGDGGPARALLRLLLKSWRARDAMRLVHAHLRVRPILSTLLRVINLPRR